MADTQTSFAEDVVSGRRLLLALGIWLVLSVGTGVLTTVILNLVARTWSASSGLIVLILAEVYLALLVALLLTFGGPTGLRDRLGFRFTSARDLLLTPCGLAPVSDRDSARVRAVYSHPGTASRYRSPGL